MVKKLFYEQHGQQQFLLVEGKKILESSCSCNKFEKNKKCSHIRRVSLWIEFGKEK